MTATTIAASPRPVGPTTRRQSTPPSKCLCIVGYNTIRDAILTCARKPTWVSVICRTEPTTKKCKNRKTKSRKQIWSEITLNSLGNPCSESWKRKRKGCSGKDLQKTKVLSLQWKREWVMGGDVTESMGRIRSPFCGYNTIPNALS